MEINSISDFRAAVRNGPYAWPGGYPLFFVMDDCGVMSFEVAARRGTTRRLILESLRDNLNDGWRPVAIEINYDNNDLYCCISGNKIESAYGE